MNNVHTMPPPAAGSRDAEPAVEDARSSPSGETLPRLYVIIDLQTLARHQLGLAEYARQLCQAGVTLVQIRGKGASEHEMVAAGTALVRELPEVHRLLNDRADLVVKARADGVHLGQGDMPIAAARALLGPEAILGLSTHTDEQVIAGDQTGADYLAIGPVFATQTKPDAEPAVGLEGVRRARALTCKPLVAIGGITRANCRAVLDAGADSVAVISALFAPGETVEEVARDFLRILR